MSEWPKMTQIDFDGFKITHIDCGLVVRYDINSQPYCAYVTKFQLGKFDASCEVPQEEIPDGGDVAKVRAYEAVGVLEALVTHYRRDIKDPVQLEIDSRGA